MMSIQKDINELLEANVISPETADRIERYYDSQKSNSSNRLVLVFSILGATLVGLGIILIIAHNWDALSRSSKTIIGFIPLLVGQILCAYAIWKKSHQVAWIESSAAFLFFAVGANIALVSQIYNIMGEMSSYLLTWVLLCLPLVYVMRTSVVSLLYLIGITAYAVNVSSNHNYWYWILFLSIVPHLYYLYQNRRHSNFWTLHHWLIPFSLAIALFTVEHRDEEFLLIAYMSLFALFFLWSKSAYFPQQKSANGYHILSTVGTTVLLLVGSFNWFWKELVRENLFTGQIWAPELWAAMLLTGLAFVFFISQIKNQSLEKLHPLSYIFILFITAFVLAHESSIFSAVIINFVTLGWGLWTIRDGIQKTHFGILNFGLLILAALISCRFFDTNMSFVFRGLLFVLLGAAFFGVNYWMLKQSRLVDS